MALIQYAAPWDRQPQETVEENPTWANRGLIGLWNFANGTVGTVGGDASLSGIPDFVASGSGLGWKNTTISSNQKLLLPDLSTQIGITNEVTLVLILGGGNNTTQGLANIGGVNNTTQSDHYPYRPASTDLIYSSLFKANRWVSGVTSLVDHTKPHVVGVQFKNGLQRYTQAGRQLATASNAVDPIWPSWARLLVSDNTAFAYSGVTLGAAVFNRYLPDAELFEITKSVEASWQLFAPQTIWVPVSAGGGPSSQTISPSSISSLEAFGTHAITIGSISVLVSSISSSETFGSHIISNGSLIVIPSGIVSLETFGTAILDRGTIIVSPNGISTAEAFGTSSALVGTLVIYPNGISSAELFGISDISGGVPSIVTSVFYVRGFSSFGNRRNY
jgi:hypothetical protein